MRWHVLAVPVMVAALVGLLPRSVDAQTRTARGTVTDLQGNTLTVKVGDQSMAFQVDSRTIVTAEGAGTASRAAAAAGRSGPKLSDLIKAGDAVEVMYHDANGARQANKIRRTRTPGSRTNEATAVEQSNGTVESVTGSAITITGGGPGRQTFVVDRDTKVIARGAGTASRSREGGVTVPDLVSVGDRVSVSYHRAGNALHAAEIRVR
jgi:hypothetical protein